MKGRKPLPTKIKILEENPGKRPLNLNEKNIQEIKKSKKEIQNSIEIFGFWV